MIREALAEKTLTALRRLAEAGAIPAEGWDAPEIAEPKQAEHGDFACNWAMVNAKRLGKNPRELGDALAAELSSDPDLSAVEVAGPGFLNFRLAPEFQSRFIAPILSEPEALRPKAKNPQKINVEFVSVNPNGPITIGSGRGAAYGSTLCNVLEAAGNEVHREYYINDGVNSEQMRLFAESVRAIVLGQPVPDNGYKGDYVHHVGEQVVNLSREYRLKLVRPLIFEIKRLRHHLNGPQHEKVQRFAHLVVPHVVELQRLEHLYHELTKAEAIEHAIDLLQKLVNDPTAEAHQTLDTIREAVREMPATQLQAVVQEFMLDAQRVALGAFGVTFDTWFSEQSLHDAGQVPADIQTLADQGVADTRPVRTKLKLGKGGKVEEVEQEAQTAAVDDDGNALSGAASETLWLRSTKFGDDQDRVLRRGDGRLTYIASDVAYHKDKFNRPAGADKLITILGPDHHGYIGRLQAVVAAMLKAEGKATVGAHSEEPLSEIEQSLYESPEERDACRAALTEAKKRLEVQIYQLVRFMKDGQPAPMRKRDGNIYALMDLIREIGEKMRPEGTEAEKLTAGKDVARFFYLMRSHDTTFDFDLNLAETKSDENPVFYVQYAHARICSILAKAQEEGLQAGEAALSHPLELALLRKVCDLPWEIERCAADYGVHRLVTYAIELARAYHHFYGECRVVDPQDPATSRSRLALCQATALALREALSLLGVSAPERM